MKSEDVSQVHNAFNEFDKNLLLICSKINYLTSQTLNYNQMELIFYKDTDTGLYVDFTSFLPWTYRASSLVT